MSEGRFLKGWERMRVHTGKGVLLGSEGGNEGILLFLGGSKGFTNKGEVLLHGELWRSGDREILINWRKKKKRDFKINSKEIKYQGKKKILINGEK